VSASTTVRALVRTVNRRASSVLHTLHVSDADRITLTTHAHLDLLLLLRGGDRRRDAREMSIVVVRCAPRCRHCARGTRSIAVHCVVDVCKVAREYSAATRPRSHACIRKTHDTHPHDAHAK
jgi:hypothetical protein